MQTDLLERDLCYSIVGAFFEVYNYFGCGLSESIYTNALEFELIDRGHRVAREVVVDVRFKGRHVGWQRIDMIVDDRVIVEVKATEKLAAFSEQQILSYLRISPIQLGLILHFGSKAYYKRYADTHKRNCVSVPKNSRHSPHSPHSRSNPVPSHLGKTDSEPGKN